MILERRASKEYLKFKLLFHDNARLSLQNRRKFAFDFCEGGGGVTFTFQITLTKGDSLFDDVL